MQDGSGRLRLGSTVDQSGKRKDLTQEATTLLVMLSRALIVHNKSKKEVNNSEMCHGGELNKTAVPSLGHEMRGGMPIGVPGALIGSIFRLGCYH
jgi:hypothetical protein